MPKTYTGPKGGKYQLVKGRKVYVSASAPASKSVSGKGAYKVRSSMPSRRRSTVSRRGVRGRGGYFSDLWSGVKKVGGQFVKPLLGAVGTGLGGPIAKVLSSAVGLGDYKVKENTLMGLPTGGMNGLPPTIKNYSDRTIVTHREYISEISSSIDFENRSFDINPGLSSTFPWLSGVAKNWEQHKWHGLIFGFESTSADALNSTNTALGQVTMATNYVAIDPPYQSNLEMLNTQYFSTNKPSCSFLHPVECAPNQQAVSIYTNRSGPPPSNEDLRLFDIGKFQLATSGSQAVATVGRLFVSYQVEFFKTIITEPVGKSVYTANVFLQGSGVSNSTPFGNSPQIVFDNIGVSVTSSTVSIDAPPGPNNVWLITYSMIGASSAVVYPQIVPGGEADVYNLYQDSTQPQQPIFGATSTATTCMVVSAVITNGPLNLPFSFQLLSGTLVTSASSGQLVITRINPASIGTLTLQDELKLDRKGIHFDPQKVDHVWKSRMERRLREINSVFDSRLTYRYPDYILPPEKIPEYSPTTTDYLDFLVSREGLSDQDRLGLKAIASLPAFVKHFEGHKKGLIFGSMRESLERRRMFENHQEYKFSNEKAEREAKKKIERQRVFDLLKKSFSSHYPEIVQFHGGESWDGHFIPNMATISELFEGASSYHNFLKFHGSEPFPSSDSFLEEAEAWKLMKDSRDYFPTPSDPAEDLSASQLMTKAMKKLSSK